MQHKGQNKMGQCMIAVNVTSPELHLNCFCSYHPLMHLAEFWYRDASERSQSVTCANQPVISASCRSSTVPFRFLQHFNLMFQCAFHVPWHGRVVFLRLLYIRFQVFQFDDLAVTFCGFANSPFYSIHFYLYHDALKCWNSQH